MSTLGSDEPASPPQASTSAANKAHLKQKRARSQLSCTPCRQGKLKCNRAHDPACDQCIKRNREGSCVFPPPPTKHSRPAQNVKGRIRQLEDLVVNLMQNQNAQRSASNAGHRGVASEEDEMKAERQTEAGFAQLTPSDSDRSPQTGEYSHASSESPPDDVDAATPMFGKMKISKNEISYVGESHWGAILNSIDDLKRDLGDEPEDDQVDDDEEGEAPTTPMSAWNSSSAGMAQPEGVSGLGFMLGGATRITKQELISNIPDKRIADRLLSLWFNSPDPFKPIIHAPTFQEEYRRFWRDPKDVSTMWLGLLYSILSLAASFGLRDLDPSSPQAKKILADVNKYHTLAASAAVLADFTKPKQYTIECLILYGAGLRSNNAFVNVWLMIGLVVRLALRMGYHRDPSHYPNISEFHGEMRRRVWAVISMIDSLISFQLGLPSMVKTIQSDARPPRNLLDRDFNPTTKVLPPSRGIDELTPSSYTRAKLSTVRVFADAAELSHATVPPAHDKMMELDRQLEVARASVPPLLQMPDISEVVTDPAEQLMCRFNLDLLYLKTKLTLHRRYMLTPLSELSATEQQQGIGDSRKICIQSAMRVLQHHQTIYAASQAGGQLESVKWYMGSISTHDFLLAAMVLCLELSQQIHDSEFRETAGGIPCPQRQAMMQTLEKSQKIWSDTTLAPKQKNASNPLAASEKLKTDHMWSETERASRAMAAMLKKVKRQFGTQCNSKGPAANAPPAAASLNTNNSSFASASQGDMTNGSTQQPFNGLVSTHQWGNLGGVPDGLSLGGGSFNNGVVSNGSVNNPAAFNPVNNDMFTGQLSPTDGLTPPDDANMGQMDFSMIGDMLDVNNANLDWQMWDNQITTGPEPQVGEWSDQVDSSMSNTNPSDVRFFGNSLLGGSGVVADQYLQPSPSAYQPSSQSPQTQQQVPPVIPGNVMMGGGTGPLPPSQTIHGLKSPAIDFSNDSFGFTPSADGSYNGMDFGAMDANMLQDVQFDSSDYNTQTGIFSSK